MESINLLMALVSLRPTMYSFARFLVDAPLKDTTEISSTNFGSLAEKINIDFKGIDSEISNDVISSRAKSFSKWYVYIALLGKICSRINNIWPKSRFSE